MLFLVLNKANPKQAQFASIVHYWDLYADDAQLRKKLEPDPGSPRYLLSEPWVGYRLVTAPDD